MTLYQRILKFYERDKFRFDERTKKRIGSRVASLWKEMHGNDPRPALIDSKEDSGTYTVCDYPDHFTPLIDQLIRNVHKEILQRAKVKRRSLAAEAQKKSLKQPSPAVPAAKKRKRIPVKSLPAWKAH